MRSRTHFGEKKSTRTVRNNSNNNKRSAFCLQNRYKEGADAADAGLHDIARPYGAHARRRAGEDQITRAERYGL